MDFTGQSRALSQQGLVTATAALGVSPTELWTVIDVETAGSGFLPDRRPTILYERHIFHRLTNGAFDDGDISSPTPGGYGPSGSHQYDRLARAIALDRAAALSAASWGLGQILAQNFRSAGFADIESMVAAMVDSEDSHLASIAAFAGSTGLAAPLSAHDWTAFARAYNGPSFAQNQYDVKLQQSFQKFSAGPLPDLSVRAVQLYLTFAGLQPGPIDGRLGQRTRTALAQFNAQHNLPDTPTVDDAVAASIAQVVLV